MPGLSSRTMENAAQETSSFSPIQVLFPRIPRNPSGAVDETRKPALQRHAFELRLRATHPSQAEPPKPTMKNIRMPSSVALLASAVFLAATVHAGPDCDAFVESENPDATVILEDSECGNACVMVFGTVGEALGISLADGPAQVFVKCEEGLNAMGEPCVLPEGIVFDQESLSLHGVPSKPGFHEFVVLMTEKGVTREQVVLIDIQPAPSLQMQDAYASYFFGGIR